MSTFNLDRDKCLRRSRLAGVRGQVECSRVRWLSREDLASTAVAAKGKLPADDDEALAIINSKIPGPKLSADQVYIHYMEAASDRFIGDRFMFLDSSTLKNIVKGADAGFAFMNSHRTGDLSTPSELPFGRAFTGQYRTLKAEDGSKVRTAVLGVYMLRGQKPNGANGPSTDDLSASISGGTIFDVSMGLYGGSRICDVCGQDFYARDEDGSYLCKHVPGTHRKMSKDEINAQKAKGVPNGEATYSLYFAEPGEVSAVYDGAIPGAGFRKALSLHRSNQLSRSDWRDALAAYPALKIDRKDRPMSFAARLKALLRQNPDLIDELEDDGDELPPARLTHARIAERLSTQGSQNENDAELTRLRKELETERKKSADAALAREQSEAQRFAADTINANKAVPAERDALAALHLRLARLDREHPVQGESSNLSLLTGLVNLRSEHTLAKEVVASAKDKLTTLPSDPADGDAEADEDQAYVESLRKNAREAVGLK